MDNIFNIKNKMNKKLKSNLYILAIFVLIYTHKINERNICKAIKIE